jgi:CheY-like chemotaxis protein
MQTQLLKPADRVAGRLPRILVIDDEAGFTRLMKINLEATGRYLVKMENDSFSAIDTALAFHPDLVLMDVMMPGLDGGDLANRFAGHPQLKQVPVIFLTATMCHSEVESRAGSFGGLRFLSKPGALQELLEYLDEHFAGHPDAT